MEIRSGRVKVDHSKATIKVINSPIKLIDGGADILAATTRKRQIVNAGDIEISPLAIRMLRVLTRS